MTQLRELKIWKTADAFTLIEVLAALTLIGIVLAGAVTSMFTYTRSNRQVEIVFEGAQAAQTIIDELRYQDIATLPESGTDDPVTIATHTLRNFDVYVTYCKDPTYCTSDDVRQISVDVKYRGKIVYFTETIFTQLEKGSGSSDDDEAASSSSGGSSGSSSSSSGSSSGASSSSGGSSSSSSGRRRRCRTWRC